MLNPEQQSPSFTRIRFFPPPTQHPLNREQTIRQKKGLHNNILQRWWNTGRWFSGNLVLIAQTSWQRALPLGKLRFHHTTAPAVMQVLTSCVPGKMLLLAEVVTGDGFGRLPESGDVHVRTDRSTCGTARYLWPRFALFSSTLSLCSVMRAKCSLSLVPEAL